MFEVMIYTWDVLTVRGSFRELELYPGYWQLSKVL